jgi:hypothetical protein
MKRLSILIISALSLISLYSCSTYKNTATPDDVYYSPGTAVTQGSGTQTNNGSDYYSTPNDNYVKMRVEDPTRWSYFDDYGYDYYGSGFSPYGFGPSIGFGVGFGFGSPFYSPFYGGFGYYSPLSYYNSYYAWNNFYNPYYGGVVVVNGKNTAAPGYTRMSNFNPSAYQGRYYNSRPASQSFLNSNAFRNSQNLNQNSNNLNRSFNNRPNNFSNPSFRSSNFGGGGGGGGMRAGGFSRPGR